MVHDHHYHATRPTIIAMFSLLHWHGWRCSYFFFFRCSQIILTWTEAWGTVSQAVRQAGTTHIFTFVSFVCRCQGCLLRLDVHLLWPAHEQKQNPCHCIYDSLFSLHSLANPATNDNEKSEEKKISCGAGNSVARHIYIYADIRYGLEYFRIKLYLVYLCVRCVCVVYAVCVFVWVFRFDCKKAIIRCDATTWTLFSFTLLLLHTHTTLSNFLLFFFFVKGLEGEYWISYLCAAE